MNSTALVLPFTHWTVYLPHPKTNLNASFAYQILPISLSSHVDISACVSIAGKTVDWNQRRQAQEHLQHPIPTNQYQIDLEHKRKKVTELRMRNRVQTRTNWTHWTGKKQNGHLVLFVVVMSVDGLK
jgi:hypothetical protein